MRYAVLFGEQCAQRLVAPYDVAQGGPQGVGVQGAVEFEDERDVVGGAGAFEPVEEPQALLRVGQWQRIGPLCHGQYGRAGASRRVQDAGKARDGRVLEEGAYGDLRAQDGADTADDAHREEGVPAEVEEAVVRADEGPVQDVGEDPGEQLLREGAPSRSGGGVGVRPGLGQGAPVHLAVGQDGEDVQDDDGAGHHVVRQGLGEGVAQGGGARGRVAGDGVGDEPAPSGYVLADHGAGGRDAGQGQERGLDLAQLDAEAA